MLYSVFGTFCAIPGLDFGIKIATKRLISLLIVLYFEEVFLWFRPPPAFLRLGDSAKVTDNTFMEAFRLLFIKTVSKNEKSFLRWLVKQRYNRLLLAV